MTGRLCCRDVEPGARNPPVLQRLDERCLSTVGPRPVLMKIAFFFICRKCVSFSMPCASSVAGACIETKSDCCNTSDSVAGIASYSGMTSSSTKGS